VEISAAHCHLIDQFWGPHNNFRTDEFGGELENRMRFGYLVIERVRQAGLRFKQKLAAIHDAHPGVIAEVRGEGLLLGLKCGVPNKVLVAALAGEKMLAVPAADNVVRLLPPLIVSDEEIDEACARLERACGTVAEKAGAAGQGRSDGRA